VEQKGLFMKKRKTGEMDVPAVPQISNSHSLEQSILSAEPSQDADLLDSEKIRILSPVRGKGPSTDEVGRRFWWDPAACLKNHQARTVIRNRTVGERPWLPTLDVADSAVKKRGLRAEQIKSGIAEILEQWHLPWWQALKNGVVSKDVPPGIAERIADLLAGFVLAQNVVGSESQRVRVWFSRTRKMVGLKRARKNRPSLGVLSANVRALIAFELRHMNLGKRDTARLILELFTLIGGNPRLLSVERILRRLSQKRTHRNK
jgi:hypothetical protein